MPIRQSLGFTGCPNGMWGCMDNFDSDNQRAHGSLNIPLVRLEMSNGPLRLREAAPACTMRIRMCMEEISGRATMPHVCSKGRGKGATCD